MRIEKKRSEDWYMEFSKMVIVEDEANYKMKGSYFNSLNKVVDDNIYIGISFDAKLKENDQNEIKN